MNLSVSARTLTSWLLLALVATSGVARGTPDDDKDAFQRYFSEKYPTIPSDDFAFGSLTFDPAQREAYKNDEADKLVQATVDEGKRLFNKALADGKAYSNCFRNAGYSIAADYPYFDVVSNQVKTLELEINECRKKHGDEPLPYDSAAMGALTAYMASTSQGNRVNVIISDDTRAVDAFNKGKRMFYTRRGQQNMSCAQCHMVYSGKRWHAATLAPALGLTLRAPFYRPQWNGMGILHRSFAECMTRMGAKPYELQSEDFRNLEFYLSYVSNGLPLRGPSHSK